MTDDASPADASPSAASPPWHRRPHWWPVLALVPVAPLALTALLLAAQTTRGESRVYLAINGILILPIGTLIYVWLSSMISPVRWPRARTVLAGITTAVTFVGGAVWFGSTFQPPHVRAAFSLYEMDPAAAYAAMGFLLCVVWGLILLVTVVVLAILGRIADVRAEREADSQNRAAA